jgi:hypothetical protein
MGWAGQLAGAERSAAREGSVSLVGCAHDDDPLGVSGPGPQVWHTPSACLAALKPAWRGGSLRSSPSIAPIR